MEGSFNKMWRKLSQRLSCPFCKQPVSLMEGSLSCPRCKRIFPIEDDFCDLTKELSDFVERESLAHELVGADELDDHVAYNTTRNIFMHRDALAPWLDSVQSGLVLELACGPGHDAVTLLERNNCVVCTDICKQILFTARKNIRSSGKQNSAIYIRCDGQTIPFSDGTFDAVYIVAGLHHMESPEGAFAEMLRVAKAGAHVMIAIEPSPTYYRMRILGKVIENTLNFRRRMKKDERMRSVAEATTSGFRAEFFQELSTLFPARLVGVKYHWFLTGYLHVLDVGLRRIFGLHFLRSTLRIDRFFCSMDRMILRNRILRRWAWHHTVYFQKLGKEV